MDINCSRLNNIRLRFSLSCYWVLPDSQDADLPSPIENKSELIGLQRSSGAAEMQQTTIEYLGLFLSSRTQIRAWINATNSFRARDRTILPSSRLGDHPCGEASRLRTRPTDTGRHIPAHAWHPGHGWRVNMHSAVTLDHGTSWSRPTARTRYARSRLHFPNRTRFPKPLHAPL